MAFLIDDIVKLCDKIVLPEKCKILISWLDLACCLLWCAVLIILKIEVLDDLQIIGFIKSVGLLKTVSGASLFGVYIAEIRGRRKAKNKAYAGSSLKIFPKDLDLSDQAVLFLK